MLNVLAKDNFFLFLFPYPACIHAQVISSDVQICFFNSLPSTDGLHQGHQTHHWLSTPFFGTKWSANPIFSGSATQLPTLPVLPS